MLTAGHYLLLRASSGVAVNEDNINLSVKGQSKRGSALHFYTISAYTQDHFFLSIICYHDSKRLNTMSALPFSRTRMFQSKSVMVSSSVFLTFIMSVFLFLYFKCYISIFEISNTFT